MSTVTNPARLDSARTGPAPQTIDEMLAHARSALRRMYAFEVPVAIARGAILVDIRPQAQRAREGILPGALATRRPLPGRTRPPTPPSPYTPTRRR